MKQFIEVTEENGQKITINVSVIGFVKHRSTKGTEILLTTSLHVKVKEEYNQVISLIQEAL